MVGVLTEEENQSSWAINNMMGNEGRDIRGGGAGSCRAFKLKTRNLCWIWKSPGSQWRGLRRGIMWSEPQK